MFIFCRYNIENLAWFWEPANEEPLSFFPIRIYLLFIFSGTGPDGVTRGAFSYLDDKGVQRSIQYIAGAGIGYRIVQDTTGPGSHLLPRPASTEFGILYPKGNHGPLPNDHGGSNDSFGQNDGSNSIDSDFADFEHDLDAANHRPGSDPLDSNFPNRGVGGGTIIVNSGDTFFGLPPGASARAHVQNIDLRPIGGGQSISPSEALRRDVRRSFRFRYRG